MQSEDKYLANLTPLRGIAALWVVVFHFSDMVATIVSTDESQLLHKGYLTVDLFFILSGFIICHVYQSSFQAGVSRTAFRNFAVARFARIYPLHVATLILSLALVPLTGWDEVYDPKAIPTNLLLIHSFGIHGVFTWNIPSWSISAEWWAYMAFPLLVRFLATHKRAAITVMTSLSIALYLLILYRLPRVDSPPGPGNWNLDVTYNYGLLRGLAGFMLGMLLYGVYEQRRFSTVFEKDLTAVVLVLGAMGCMHVGANDGFAVILFVGIVYAFALNKGRVHAWCNHPIPQYLGKISYSIYLMQLFPQILISLWWKLPGVVYAPGSVTGPLWITLGYCVIYVLIIIGMASLTYFGIEKPARKYLNAKWGKETMPVYA